MLLLKAGHPSGRLSLPPAGAAVNWAEDAGNRESERVPSRPGGRILLLSLLLLLLFLLLLLLFRLLVWLPPTPPLPSLQPTSLLSSPSLILFPFTNLFPSSPATLLPRSPPGSPSPLNLHKKEPYNEEMKRKTVNLERLNHSSKFNPKRRNVIEEAISGM